MISKLASVTKLSPNHSGKRNHAVDRITPHCFVGQVTVERGLEVFLPSSKQASCQYVIAKDGAVGCSVDEENRSWCTSSSSNDHRAITIECASDTVHPYTMNSSVYDKLIELCVDICQRYGKKKLIWIADKNQALAYEPKADEMQITVHRWFANKACPGDWLFNRLGEVAKTVTNRLSQGVVVEPKTGLQARDLVGLSEASTIAKVAPLFTADQKKSGVLASVSFAQFILESGYAKSELAQAANNCFGMKKSLSGNTWGGSTWDGSSIYTKKTQEQNPDGTYETITADFRKYACIEDSIADHSAYLLGAKNGSKLRYTGLKGCTDYKKAAQIIKDGGYATSLDYVSKLCAIIEKWNLTQYDVQPQNRTNNLPDTPFTVTVIVNDLNIRKAPEMGNNIVGQTGKGVFTILEVKNGWGRLKSGLGWIYLENSDYCTINGTVQATPKPFEPYKVRVKVSDLNIRKDATIDSGAVGYTGKGVFTIIEEKTGKVNKSGKTGLWGKLKSGMGWICLEYSDYTEKV